MGRPQEHDQQTAAALLEAAERAVTQFGPDAISIRGVATDAGTTTRAVYSLFGSKQGLIAALAAHAFDLLREEIANLPTTAAPDHDLVEAGLVIRRFAIGHPSLYRLAFRNHADAFMHSIPVVHAAAIQSLAVLTARVAQLETAGRLNGHSADEASLYFRSLCDGLAGLELGGTIPQSDAEHVWRQGLHALIQGLITS